MPDGSTKSKPGYVPGKSLTVPKEVRKTPLTVAMSTGFHSLVELLLRHEQSQEVKNDALRQALFLNRPAFVELALAHGAEIGSIPFLDVLMTGDRAVVASFLERGADPITDYPFARAFHELRAKTTLGSYLDCRRSRPDLAEICSVRPTWRCASSAKRTI